MTTRKPKAITINYNKAKLYSLRSPHTEKIYIGATTQTLSQRMTQHRSDFKQWTDGKCNYVSSFEILKSGNAYIELLRECPCENKEQLAKAEGEAIRDTANCCNKIIAGRTTKEYRENNKEAIKQQRKQHYEDNKERLQQRKKQYREANKDRIKQYREANKDKIKQYREANKDKIKEYYEANKGAICQHKKEYYEANKDKINQRQRELRQQKKTTI